MVDFEFWCNPKSPYELFSIWIFSCHMISLVIRRLEFRSRAWPLSSDFLVAKLVFILYYVFSSTPLLIINLWLNCFWSLVSFSPFWRLLSNFARPRSLLAFSTVDILVFITSLLFGTCDPPAPRSTSSRAHVSLLHCSIF